MDNRAEPHQSQTMQQTATHCLQPLQHAATQLTKTHCNTLHLPATPCKSLQHPTTRYVTQRGATPTANSIWYWTNRLHVYEEPMAYIFLCFIDKGEGEEWTQDLYGATWQRWSSESVCCKQVWYLVARLQQMTFTFMATRRVHLPGECCGVLQCVAVCCVCSGVLSR